MKTFLRLLLGVMCLVGLSSAAKASVVLYTFNNVTLDDGGTVSGSFAFDADAGTACNPTASPCGVYSNVDIVTTTGTSLPGATYTAVCGQDDTSCTGVVPDSTEVLFLTSSAADQTGDTALAVFFLAAGPVPPAGLSDAGGFFDVSDTIAGAVNEAVCSDGACSTPGSPSRASISGDVTSAAPEPATFALMFAGFGALAMLRRRSISAKR